MLLTTNIFSKFKLDYLQHIRHTLEHELKLPSNISLIICRCAISQLDIDIAIDREVTEINTNTVDSITSEYVQTITSEEDWAAQVALEQDTFSTPDIISVSWLNGGITFITKTDSYWGTY